MVLAVMVDQAMDMALTSLQVQGGPTGGRKREASLLLGWGRNTLTRKISELRLSEDNLI